MKLEAKLYFLINIFYCRAGTSLRRVNGIAIQHTSFMLRIFEILTECYPTLNKWKSLNEKASIYKRKN